VDNPDFLPTSFHVAEQVKQSVSAAAHAGEIEVFSVAYMSSLLQKSCFVVLTVLHARHV
jgi:hypothetical protein